MTGWRNGRDWAGGRVPAGRARPEFRTARPRARRGARVRAAVVHETGPEAVTELRDDVRAVGPGPREVKVRLRATGVCHSDLSVLSGVIPSGMPAVLGHEGAGQVTEVGDQVTSVAPGQHVVVSWTPACGHCAECHRGQPFLCLTYVLEGFRTPRFTLGCGTPPGGGGVINTARVTPGSSGASVRGPARRPCPVRRAQDRSPSGSASWGEAETHRGSAGARREESGPPPARQRDVRTSQKMATERESSAAEALRGGRRRITLTPATAVRRPRSRSAAA